VASSDGTTALAHDDRSIYYDLNMHPEKLQD